MDFFLRDCDSLSKEGTTDLFSFLGRLANDEYFHHYMARAVIPRYHEFVESFIRLTVEGPGAGVGTQFSEISRFLVHAFSDRTLVLEIKEGLNWIAPAKQTLNVFRQWRRLYRTEEYGVNTGALVLFANLIALVNAGFSIGKNDAMTRAMLETLLDWALDFQARSSQICERDAKVDDLDRSLLVYRQFAVLFDDVAAQHHHPTVDFLLKRLFDISTQTGSVLEIPFLLVIPAHNLAFRVAMRNCKDYPELLRKICQGSDMDEGLINFLNIPLQRLAVYALYGAGLFPRNPDTMGTVIQAISYGHGVSMEFMPLFRMIQIVFGTIGDIGLALNCFLTTFGFYSDGLSSADQSAVLHRLLHYLSCVIFDRLCLLEDMQTVRRLHVMTRLKSGPMSITELSDSFTWANDDGRFVEDFQKFTTRIDRGTGACFRLNDDSEWHCLLPWEYFDRISALTAGSSAQNPTAVFRFPSFEKVPFNLSLARILFHHTTLALVYHTLSEFRAQSSVANDSHVQYVSNILLQAFVLNQPAFVEPPEIISAKDFADLNSQFSSITFPSFPLQRVSYCGRDPMCVRDFLVSRGPLGHSVLSRLGFAVPDSPPISRDSRINSIKSRLIGQFAEQARAVLGTNSPVDAHSSLACVVCSLPADPSFLAYPVIFFRSVLSSIVKRQLSGHGEIAVRPALRLCLHLVHPSCLPAPPFSCPCDRGMRNALLPHWELGFTSPPEHVRAGMSAFCSLVFRSCDRAVWVLSREIALMEVRQRSCRQAPDDRRFSTLVRHAFFGIAHGFPEPVDRGVGKFITVIYTALIRRSLTLETGMAADLDVSRRYVFLRKCAILEYCLSDDGGRDHDWTVELGWGALAARYGVDGAIPSPLPAFTFCDLPDTFIGFFTSENPVQRNRSDSLWLSLLTGDSVVSERGNDAGSLDISAFVEKMKHSYAPMLVIRGSDANTTFYFSMQWNRHYDRAMDALYVDQLGDPDIGFRRGEFLKLSHDAVEREIERVLSHAWVDHVT
jgi:hypothetical protein